MSLLDPISRWEDQKRIKRIRQGPGPTVPRALASKAFTPQVCKCEGDSYVYTDEDGTMRCLTCAKEAR